MNSDFSKRIAIAMTIAVFFTAKLADAESLRDAMASAYSNSGLLEQNRALLRAADEDVAVAASSLRGVLGWSANIERNIIQSLTSSSARQETDAASTEASVGLTASITIYDGGQNRFALAAAKEAVLATRQKLVSVEQMVLLSAVEAFMDVRRERKFVALRKNNLRVIEEELKAARDRFEVGEVTKTDVAFAEARLSASVSSLAAAKGTLAQAEEVYKQNVGVRAGSLDDPGILPKLPSSSSSAKKEAVQNHPDIIAVQHDIKQAEFNIKRVTGSLRPSLKLSTLLGYTDQEADDFRRSGSVSLSASGPIYSGGRTPALLRKARAHRDAKLSVLHIMRLKLERETGSAFALLQMAKAGRMASEEQIRASRVAFDGVREEAKVGSRTTLDVLNAEQELLDAQAGLISAEADEFFATYRLLSQVGKLTVDHLNLSVQKYDPSEYYNLVKSAPVSLSDRGKKLDQVLKVISK